MNVHNLILNPQHIPLSLYIHIPWCVKKCPYCDFNSHVLSDSAPFAAYVDALLADAAAQVEFLQGRRICSVFIGGGTPSLLPIDEYQRLFDGLRHLFEFDEHTEITLEANPGTLEHAPFADYLELGINRISIGVQSFDKQMLQVLGRIHHGKEAVEAICRAKIAGFKRINTDLMYGLPCQTPELALADIDQAVQAGATHLSWYQLTIEPNTAFYRAPPDLPDEDTMAEIERVGRECLLSLGFDNYEISAWVGQSDTPCWHNLNYWQFGDYLAIGAGAHGKVSLLNHPSYTRGVYRFYKSRLPKDYMTYDDSPRMVSFERVEEGNLPFEFMMNTLRLKNGVKTQLFEERTGLLISTIDNELIPLQHQGLMVNKPDILAPTQLGFRYVNRLIQSFL